MSNDEKLICTIIKASLWIGFSDGEFAQSERSSLFKRLDDRFKQSDLVLKVLNRIADDFHNDPEGSVESFKSDEAVKSFKKLYKSEILSFAWKCAKDDNKLTEQEGFAYGELEKHLDSI